ncbi:MAG: hypothetical protein RL078_1622 [Bacteroidota bacterium]
MNPYSGPWTQAEAAHLLRRTTFGATYSQIEQAVGSGLNATLAQLLSLSVLDQPLAYDSQEQIVSLGTTWVNAVYPADVTANQQTENARRKSLGAWLMKNINHEQLNLNQKMLFFWQNHFGVTTSGDARAMYQFLSVLQQHALGNIKDLVKAVATDPCMLLFLNGSTNTVYSPNENFGRELLELFTIGKGPQLASGDYGNYTEEDVAAAAKIFTGFTVQGVRSVTQTQVSSQFMPLLHDNSTKTLSYHFNGLQISPNGATEHLNYIDVIFNQPETAKYICRKLYRYFVNYDISPWVETNIIAALAQTFINSNFEIQPVLSQLLGSEHFYDSSVRGAIIKSPLEAIFSMLNGTQSLLNFDLQTTAQMYLTMYTVADQMGQEYGAPPSVAGWTAYYQAPAYSKLWINSTYLKKRFDIALLMTTNGLTINGQNFSLNFLGLLNGLSDPSSAPQVIADLCLVFCPKPIDAADQLYLKSLLTGGLPDFEWTLQYNDYLADPTNSVFSLPVTQKVKAVLNTLFRMPQFHVY